MIRVPGEFAAAHRLAGFSLADLDDVLAGRLGPKVVVVLDHAVNVGARQVQVVGELADCVLRIPSRARHNRLQDLHEHLWPCIESLRSSRHELGL